MEIAGQFRTNESTWTTLIIFSIHTIALNYLHNHNYRFVNRIDRLMGIVTLLQSKKYVQAEPMAEKFSISIRTVYRDIKALNEINIPVGFEPGKGYFIMQGYFLPPVSFTQEEANAFVLMESIAAKYGDQSIKNHFSTALQKIRSVLNGNQRDQLEQMVDCIRIYKHPLEPNNLYYLSDIQQAMLHKRIIEIHYENNLREKSIREVEPIGLTYYSLDWHMIAWCWKALAYRDFKITHIKGLLLTKLPFRLAEHLDVNQYIKSLRK